MDYTAGVIVILKEGYIPMVFEKKKDWKFPSGHKEDGECPEQTAARELHEETGIIVKPEDLKMVVCEYRTSHWFYLFQARKYDPRGYKIFGNDGEKNSVFSPSEILRKKNINYSHRRLTRKFLETLENSKGFAQSA